MYFPKNDPAYFEFLEDKMFRKVILHGGGLMLVEWSMFGDAQVEAHSHPHEQMAYVLEGEFLYRYGEEERMVKSGDAFYFPPNLPHACKLLTPEGGRVLDVFTPIREDFLSQ